MVLRAFVKFVKAKLKRDVISNIDKELENSKKLTI